MPDDFNDEQRPRGDSPRRGDPEWYQDSLKERIHDEIRERIRGRMGRRRGRAFGPGLVGATILIVVGTLLFLDNVGLLEIPNLWAYWPLILVAVGAAKLFSPSSAARGPALMFVLAGIFLLLFNLGFLRWNWNAIWPLAIVGFGVVKLVQSLEHRGPRSVGFIPPDRRTVNNYLRDWALFGSVKRRIESFEGGEVLATFAGIELDFRGAQISSSDRQALLDINAVFGGVNLRIPESWKVVNRGIAIFGGYEDKTIPPRPIEGFPVPTLVLTGFCVFGGVEVKN